MLRRLLLGLFSLLIFLSLSLAKPSTAIAQSPPRCGLNNEVCCNLAGSPPNSCQTGLKCDGGKCIPDGTTEAVPERGSVRAQDEDPVGDILKEFCDRRKGNQVNLETWYSGKCKAAAGDPSSIGFSQIVLLDLYTRISGADSIDWSNPTDVIKKLITYDDKTNKVVAQIPSDPVSGGGVVGQMSNLMGVAFKSPPVSFTSYLADVRQNIEKHGLVKPAYAQGTGFGFQNLLPILPIWRAFRNVAYFVFILVFVLYGFMIMFRMKINPQNVATFQSAIPKIVLTLILITFAYAIAGFMIDLMYVIFNLILSVFRASGLIVTDNFFGDVGIKMASGQAGILVSWLRSTFISIIFVPSSIINVLTNLPGAVSLIIDAFLTVSGLGLIVRIIIIIAVGYSFVKLIFKLFEAYITVIIQVIFSPLILLQDVLPGSDAFGGWLRNIIANLSVFPVTMVMLLLSYIFMAQPFVQNVEAFGINFGNLSSFFGVQNLNSSSTGFNMPLIGGLGTGLGSNVSSSSILTVIGFFILLMASKYVDMVRDALKVPPFKYGTALGEALTTGYNVTGAWGEKGFRLPWQKRPSMYQETMAVEMAGIRRVQQAVTDSQKPLKPTESRIP